MQCSKRRRRSSVLARILRMPVQNSNLKISARPDLATNLLQILIPATFNSPLCQKGQFTLQLCPRRWFVRKIFCYYHPKVKIEKSTLETFACPNRWFLGNYLSKRQARRVVAKSLRIRRSKSTSLWEGGGRLPRPTEKS